MTELSHSLDEAELTDLFGLPDESGWQSARCARRPTRRRSSLKRVAPPARPRRSARAARSSRECLEYALDHDERFGIWGGLCERERRRLKKRAV